MEVVVTIELYINFINQLVYNIIHTMKSKKKENKKLKIINNIGYTVALVLLLISSFQLNIMLGISIALFIIMTIINASANVKHN